MKRTPIKRKQQNGAVGGWNDTVLLFHYYFMFPVYNIIMYMNAMARHESDI